MSAKVLIAGLVGGIAMYIWATVMHMSPLAMMGVSQLNDDAVTASALKTATGDKPGLYMYPAMGHDMSDASMKAMAAKLAANPSGLIIYHQAGAKGMEPRQLIGELLLELFESVLAVWLMTRANFTTLAGRVGFMAGIGVLAAVVTNGSYWLWYGYPASYSMVNMVMEFGKFLFAGLAAAFVLGWKGKGPVAANA
jgi:hypothetical protein